MSKRKIIGWFLFGLGAVGVVMAIFISIPVGVHTWANRPLYGPGYEIAFQALFYAIVNLIACIGFMVGGWLLKRSARVRDATE